MTDGSYRFGQPVGQQFFYPQNQQGHPQRLLPMNFGPKFPAQQLHHHQQPSHNQTHHQQQHPPEHAGQVHGVIGGHQHPFSPAGVSNSTPSHFTPGHLPNGNHMGSQGGSGGAGVGKINEHWQQQLQMAQDSRQASSPHHYARANAHDNKGVTASQVSGQRPENEEERNRATNHYEIRRQDWMSLDLGGQGLRALSDSLFHYTFLDKLYLNSNKLTSLPSAIGRLKNLSHLDLSCNQLSELPPELGMLVNLKNLLVFDNNLHTLPHELGALYQLEMIGLEGNPLEGSLKSEIMRNGTRALITHLREEAPVTLPPSQRDWIVLDETVSSSGVQPEKFSVLTYNTLCDRYATTSQYGYVPSLALSWEYRKELILQEVRAQNADIVCLQEVDTDSYNEYFRVQLAYNDYKGVFWPKSRAKTMAEKEAKAVDGCATLYKSQKYILLDKQVVEFANTAINRPDMKGEDDVYNRVMPRDNIAVVTFLENRLTGSRVVVVNAHIFWDPSYKDVKLVQVAILMEQVSQLVERYAKWPPCTDKTPITLSEGNGGNGNAGSSGSGGGGSGSSANANANASTSAGSGGGLGGAGSGGGASSDGAGAEEPAAKPAPSMEYASGAHIPLVVCGDLNATTGSGVYDLLAHGTLPGSHPDLAGRAYGNFTRDGMAHPFALKSSYANIGELSFTNYTPNFTEVIDYIWYSTNTLQVTGLLGEVDKEYLQRVPGFPNYHFPSDHLALLAEFMVKGSSKKDKHQPQHSSHLSQHQQHHRQQHHHHHRQRAREDSAASNSAHNLHRDTEPQPGFLAAGTATGPGAPLAPARQPPVHTERRERS